MSPTEQQLMQEYAEIAEQIKSLELRKKYLQTTLEDSFGHKEATVKLPYGTFNMVPRTTWQYSSAVKDAEEDLKIRKIEEQEKGVAEPTVVYGLRFLPAKNK